MMQRLTQLVRRLRDERGSALTEFTICLPTFVFIFIGITELAHLQKSGMEVQLNANKDMWGNAIPVQKTLMDVVHQSPQLAAITGGAQVIGNMSDYPVADGTLGASYVGLGVNGTEGEAEVAAFVGGIASLGIGTIFASEPVPTMFAEEVFQDTWPNPLPVVTEPALALWNAVVAVPPTPFVVPRQAIAAGNRYGQEEGQASKVHQSIFGPRTMTADYRVQVAPRPVQALGMTEFIPIGYNRLAAEEFPCFREVLGIAWTQPFFGCSFMLPWYLFGPPP